MLWRGRIAPTPSGYLHFGNAFNFILCWLETRSRDGELRLRIDDLDRERYRPNYLDDIFRQLDFIGLDWDQGPQSAEEHEKAFCQVLRLELYEAALQKLQTQDMLFPCSCSRSEVQERNGANFYRGFCLRNPPEHGIACSLRLKVGSDLKVSMKEASGYGEYTLGEEEAYPILRRKDGLPAYQLSSVVDDVYYETNLIVRGQDLWQSSKVQLLIAQKLDAPSFGDVLFLHHEQLSDAQGQKLSKSKEAPALSEIYRSKSSEALWRDFIRVAGLPDLAPKPNAVLDYWKNTR